MEFKIEQGEFYKGLQRAQGVVSTKGAMPILANALVEATDSGVTIFATNLDIGLLGSYEANVSTKGKVTVQAKKLHDILRELPSGEVSVKLDDDGRLRVMAGKSRFNLATIPADEYPAFPEYDDSNMIALDSDMLAEMIRKTQYSISQDETRLTLNGSYFEVSPDLAKMVATDGHRLAYIQRQGAFKVDDKVKVVITRKAISELLKMASETSDPVTFLRQDNHILFRAGSVTMVVRLIEGAFPNYEQVIPKNNEKEATIPKEPFLLALKRVATLADEKSHMVRFTFTENALSLASEGGDIGDARDELDITYSGDELVIGLNAIYVIDLLGSINSENVIFKMNDQLSPVLALSPEDDGQKCIVMPMRL